MVSAMMRPTMLSATLMEVIVVESLSKQNIAHNVFARKNFIVVHMFNWSEMAFVTMKPILFNAIMMVGIVVWPMQI
jgi:hypothetical protein